MVWLFVFVGALAFADFTVRLLAIRFALRFFDLKPNLYPERFRHDPRALEFAFVTPDGVNLQAACFSAIGPTRGVVLFCPELDSDRWSARYYCHGLREAGFDVIGLDFRNQGSSEAAAGYDPNHWPTEFEVTDILTAVEEIVTHPRWEGLPLSIMGISRGAGAALVAASRNKHVQSVICDGAFSSRSLLGYFTDRFGRLYFPSWFMDLLPQWHFKSTMWFVLRVSEAMRGCRYADVEGALKRLRSRAVLLISGERDTYVNPSITAGLHRAHASADAHRWIVPNAKHNMSRRVAMAEYDSRVVSFLTGERTAPVLSETGSLLKVRADRSETLTAHCQFGGKAGRTNVPDATAV